MHTALDSIQAIKSLVCDSRQFLEDVSKAEKKPVSETTITVLDACETPQFWRDIETVRDHLKPLKVVFPALQNWNLLLPYQCLYAYYVTVGLSALHCNTLACLLWPVHINPGIILFAKTAMPSFMLIETIHC